MNPRTTKRLLWTLLLPLMACSMAMAQQGTITGTVVDEGTGQPIPGVTVAVRGYPANATVTDSLGIFHLRPPVLLSPGRVVLQFSYIGYESTDLRPGGNPNSIRIALKKGDKSMDEVVVIGYGQTVKKRDLTGAISVVKAADIVRSPTSDPLAAIEGMVPGADITTTSGKEGAADSIHVRGTRTISGSTQPIYVIDGVMGGNINTLNPNDIESIEVMKDASSTAIYGSQGANGVVIVTTKHGTSGKVRVSYNGYMGTNGFVQYPHPRSGQSYVDLRRAAYQATGVWNSPADDVKIFSATELANIQANHWVNWINAIEQAGLRESHNVSVSGGSEKSKAYFSAGFYGDNGMIKFNNMKQYNLLMNLDQTLSPWIKTGVQAALVYSNINTRSADPYSLAETAVPLGTPYDSTGHINVYPLTNIMSPMSDDRGPLVATNNSLSTATTINAHIDLTPIKGLTATSRFGANFFSSRSGQYFDSSSLEEINNKYSYAAVTNNSTRFYEWDNIVTYGRDFGDHSVSLTGLTSFTQSIKESYTASGTGLLYSSQLFYNLAGAPNNRYIGSNYTQQNNMSYAGRLHYSYKGKYIVDVTDRYDGASILSAGHKNYNFPSAAAAWRISDEKFMENVNAISNLKLRFSYGVAGNSGIQAYGTQSYLVVQNMGFENTNAPAYIFNTSIGNLDVGWELSKTANLGLDMGLFKNRVDLALDLYNTNTDHILLLRSLPPSLGVATTWQNVGSTNNKGIEVGLTTRNVDGHNFKWSTTFSFMSNRERITRLITGSNIIDGSNSETASLLIGHPIHSFYNYVKQGIWQNGDSAKASGLVFGTTPFTPGMIKMKDLNGDGKISPDSDRTYIGSQVPKWSLGFQNTFVYKQFDLTVYAIIRWGQMIQDQDLGRYNPAGTTNGPGYFNYWTPSHPSNDFPAPKANESISSVPGYTTLEYVDGSYWKIKTATIGYTLPQHLLKKAFMSNLRAYITVNNIFVKAKSHLIKDYDPERAGSEDSPLSRQIVGGLTIGF